MYFIARSIIKLLNGKFLSLRKKKISFLCFVQSCRSTFIIDVRLYRVHFKVILCQISKRLVVENFERLCNFKNY